MTSPYDPLSGDGPRSDRTRRTTSGPDPYQRPPGERPDRQRERTARERSNPLPGERPSERRSTSAGRPRNDPRGRTERVSRSGRPYPEATQRISAKPGVSPTTRVGRGEGSGSRPAWPTNDEPPRRSRQSSFSDYPGHPRERRREPGPPRGDYPDGRRAGYRTPGTSRPRRPPVSRTSRWLIARRIGYVLVALGILVPSVIFVIAYVTASVPKPGDLRTNQVAMILGNDGKSEITKVVPPEGNRSDVTIDQVPPPVRNAVIAAEDRNFYTNPGFSISGFARAARDNILGRESAGGGSTITQQYVKNALVGDEHSYLRKVKELVISAKMAKQWSKDDILAAYLNTIYFGRNAYGISAASKAYFGKPVQELSVSEGAVLAATINLPSLLDPESNPEGAKSRWNYVLDGMVASGNLNPTERKNMTYPPVQSAKKNADKADASGPEGHIKAQVLNELAAAGISEQQLNKDGLQITTTIDPKAQKAAVDAAHTTLKGQPSNLRTASVSVDPKTGAVRAYYGGDDGNGYDLANAGLQNGSSFKVFGLAANLEQGKPLSQLYDSKPLTVDGIKITNVEGEGCGVCTIAEALKRSLNTSFYRMELEMKGNGPQKIADMAHRLGIPDQIPGVGKTLTEPGGKGPNNGIVLGQYQTRPLDMASAYATLAASGIYHKPYFVSKVVSANGDVLLDRAADAGERRVSAVVADNVTDAMKPIAQSSRNHGLAGGRDSAAKTGTAQLGDTKDNKDAWMVGYTPSLSTAVWMGTDKGEPLRTSAGALIYGSGLPSDIWKATMDGALKGTPNEKFPKPGPIKGQAGVPKWTAPYTPSNQPVQPEQAPPSQIEILPGITIPAPGGSLPQPGQMHDTGPGPQPGQPMSPPDGGVPDQNGPPAPGTNGESSPGGGDPGTSGGTDGGTDNQPSGPGG